MTKIKFEFTCTLFNLNYTFIAFEDEESTESTSEDSGDDDDEDDD